MQTMRLFFMQLGLRSDGSAHVPGYLIQTVDGQNILIDSGLPRSLVGRSTSGWQLHEEDLVTAHLAKLGLGAADIHTVICTHLDPDHAGNHDLFPQAEFYVQRKHYEFACSSGLARFGFPVAKWNDSRLQYRLIDGDFELRPGIKLIESSGHVPGHQSILLHLPQTGAVLLTADAILYAALTDPDTRAILPFDLDEPPVRASTRKLMALAARETTMLIFGHDLAQWRTLRKLPEYYG